MFSCPAASNMAEPSDRSAPARPRTKDAPKGSTATRCYEGPPIRPRVSRYGLLGAGPYLRTTLPFGPATTASSLTGPSSTTRSIPILARTSDSQAPFGWLTVSLSRRHPAGADVAGCTLLPQSMKYGNAPPSRSMSRSVISHSSNVPSGLFREPCWILELRIRSSVGRRNARPTSQASTTAVGRCQTVSTVDCGRPCRQGP